MSDPADRAARDLPDLSPHGEVLGALTAAERQRLREQVAHAQVMSGVELDQAVEAVAGLFPWPARSRARAALTGRRR